MMVVLQMKKDKDIYNIFTIFFDVHDTMKYNKIKLN